MLLPRRLLSLLISLGVVPAISCLTAAAEDRPAFEERFSEQLSGGWTWIDGQPGAWQLAGDSLELKVMPVGEGMWAGGRKHPNLLLRTPPEGDFAVEVQLKSNPTGKFEHAGLLLYADGDNYVVINKEMLDQLEIVM